VDAFVGGWCQGAWYDAESLLCECQTAENNFVMTGETAFNLVNGMDGS
jgi:hypothetical protein